MWYLFSWMVFFSCWAFTFRCQSKYIARLHLWYLYQYSVFVFFEPVRWGKCVFVGPLVDRVWTRRRQWWKRKGNPVAPSPHPQPADPKISCLSKMYFFPQQKYISQPQFVLQNWGGGKEMELAHLQVYKPQQNTCFFFNKSIFFQTKHIFVPKIVFKI